MAKAIGTQWESNPFINNVMLKPDVLTLNGAKNAV
jgi:hypothetical protein